MTRSCPKTLLSGRRCTLSAGHDGDHVWMKDQAGLPRMGRASSAVDKRTEEGRRRMDAARAAGSPEAPATVSKKPSGDFEEETRIGPPKSRWKKSKKKPASIDKPTGYVGHNHPVSAQRMQVKAISTSAIVRREVVAELLDGEAEGLGGLTDYEGCDRTGRSHQSWSGCRKKLVDDGWIEHSGLERINEYGNTVIVWKITDAGKACWKQPSEGT